MGRDRRDDRGRDRDRDRRRRRSRSRSRSRSPHSSSRRRRSRSREKRSKRSPKESRKKEDKNDPPTGTTILEFEEQKLEEEMQKRRERIESWRKKKKEQDDDREKQELIRQAEEAAEKSKTWTLEDEGEDEDEEEENGKKDGEDEAMDEAGPSEEPKAEEEEEEVDPLDAFMQGVNNEVRQMTKGKLTKDKEKRKIVKVIKVTATAGNKSKGDIIEQNADALEYSDEEAETETDGQISLATKAKQLAITDHSKVYYRPFRRNFYVEVPEISRMTEEEAVKMREELEEIKTRGKNCPKPVKTWAQCGCSRIILDVLKKHNYEKPTPIQAQAIPAVMSGRDVIGIAKTGSGKTLAFLLPMLRHIMDQEPLEEMDGPISLIMSPTRELAMQTAKECRKFTRPLGVTTVCVYGGAGISEQIAELKKGAEIVVCTPGRMIDMLAANNGRVTNLRRVTFLVLDEADRMFDMGFEPQVMRILGNIRPDRQTVLFSATFPPKMEGLARKILQKPVEILVGGKSVVCKDIDQRVVILEEYQKFLKLLELLGLYWEMGSSLVFVEKQEKCDELVGDLMKNGYNCAPLHGGIDQFDRDSTILDFKAGRIKLMIATSVAARGLDVKKLILVVNYDCPNHYEDYVHRVGRTGRAGNKGFAYTFILPETQERYAGDIHLAMERSGAEIPQELTTLWENFKAKMKEEGKDIRQGGGFGGHGYRFDEAEAEAVASKKKMEKLVKGLEADNEDEDEIDIQIQSLMKSTKRVTDATKAPTASKEKGANPVKEDLLEKAKAAAMKIQLDKNAGQGPKDSTQQTAEAIMKGSAIGPVNVSAKTIAEQRAGKLHERLNYIPTEQVKEEEVQESRYYEEELEINDFPQQVRWRVCSRETLSIIQEYSEVGISVKGGYVPPGKHPPEGDRKLYLSIESTSELALSRAKAEIVRVLREELKRMAAQGQQGGPKGRYKVL